MKYTIRKVEKASPYLGLPNNEFSLKDLVETNQQKGK